MQAELFKNPRNPWLDGHGAESDIVLSSRIRLARNFKALPFPNRADLAELGAVETRVQAAIVDLEQVFDTHFDVIGLERLNSLERKALLAKRLISAEHMAKTENRSLVISEDTGISIMVNEEDHLRIQCMASGFDLDTLLTRVNMADDVFEAREEIAFDEDMGYLTSCPTNLGTGLRASVILHLPGLVFTRQLGKIINASTQLGLAVRGLYGEGSEARGNLFQISNQLTLGYTEQEIITNLKTAVKEIIIQERAARSAIYKNSPDVVENRVWRSYGVLKYARAVGGNEALALFSEVRLGIELGIINDMPANSLNELVIATRNGFLQNQAGSSNLSPLEMDKMRANVIRDTLERAAVTAKGEKAE